jgi:hypothetical protein
MRAAAMAGSACALLTMGALAACGASATTGQGDGSGPPAQPSPPPSTVSRTVTATATATATASVPAPPSTVDATPPPAGPAAVPSGFVGKWFGHSRDLTVRRDGTVLIDFRVYITCTATRSTECDRIIGSTIEDGGHVVAHVTRVVSNTTMIMTVTSTSAPDFVPMGPVRIGHDLTHHAVAIFSGKLSGDAFCGTGSPSSYCGA